MRAVSAGALAKLAQNLGGEPSNILEIQWVPDGQRTLYGDIELATEGVKGRIVEIGGLDAVIQVSGGSDSQQISVVLDDVDGEIKAILDTNDIHKRPCWVYQWFTDLDLTDKFLLFKGFISSPLTWNEGDRTVKFEVINQIETLEVGFSIEEGDIPNPPKNLIGQPWPLAFGTVINMPVLQVQTIRQGTLVTGVGIADPTLDIQILIAEETCCPYKFEGFQAVQDPNTQSINIFPQIVVDPACVALKEATIENLECQKLQQQAFEFDSFTVAFGTDFPQGVTLTLNINGAKFTGQFTDNLFVISSRVHPGIDDDYCIPDTVPNTGQCQIADTSGAGSITNLPPQTIDIPAIPGIPTCPEEDSVPAPICGEIAQQTDFQPLNFFWANPGATVTIDGDEEIIYIVNLLPSQVLRVAAVRNFNSGPELVTVPDDFYTIRLTDYNTYQVVELVFPKPLSRIEEDGENAGWTDKVYVSLTSSVGPNTVDIIEWLITFYTDFGIDTASFDTVRDQVENYPMNFALYKSRPDLLNLLEDIAYQARCAIWLRDDVFFMKYLPLEPDIDITITADDIDQNSLEIFHTNTEDLITKSEITWRADYYVEETVRADLYIVSYNVKKYGTHKEALDYFTFSDYTLVQKSGTFWIIRHGNTWRKLSFTTPMHMVRAEVFDTIGIILPSLAPGTIKCIVEQASYNSQDQTMEFILWTPLRSGTLTPYDFAWPADVEEFAIFPTQDEIDNGQSGVGDTNPNFGVVAPPDHPLSAESTLPQGFSLNESCSSNEPGGVTVIDATGQNCKTNNGGKFPSDVGDQKPAKPLPSGYGIDPKTGNPNTGVTNQSGVSPDSTSACCKELQKQIDQLKKDLANSQADTPEELPSCEESDCGSQVTVQYTTPDLVARDGEFHTDGCGTPVSGTGRKVDYCFGSLAAAQSFKEIQQGIADSQGSEQCIGTEYIVTVTAASNNSGGECPGDDFDSEGSPIIKGMTSTDL